MIAHVLYWWLVVVGSVDLFLVAPALVRAEHRETVGRLLATLATLAGMVFVGSGRVLEPVITLPVATAVGMVLVDTGLVGYAIFLPSDGIAARLRRRWRR